MDDEVSDKESNRISNELDDEMDVNRMFSRNGGLSMCSCCTRHRPTVPPIPKRRHTPNL
jgi:hypothetical protein